MFHLLLMFVPATLADDVTIAGTQAPGKKFETPETHLASEFGGAWTTGNTSSWSLNGGLTGSHRVNRSEFSLKLGANVGQSIVDADANAFLDTAERDAGYVPSAQKYFGTLRYDYYVGENDTLYLQADELIDRFAGYASRTQGEFGYRRILANTDQLDLSAELGTGMVKEVYVDDANEATAASALFVGARAKVDLAYTFNENVALTESIELYDPFYDFTAGASAVDRFRFGNTASLVAKLTDTFSLKVSHQVTYNNVPNTITLPVVNTTPDTADDTKVVSFQKTDQTTLVTFVASLL